MSECLEPFLDIFQTSTFKEPKDDTQNWFTANNNNSQNCDVLRLTTVFIQFSALPQISAPLRLQILISAPPQIRAPSRISASSSFFVIKRLFVWLGFNFSFSNSFTTFIILGSTQNKLFYYCSPRYFDFHVFIQCASLD